MFLLAMLGTSEDLVFVPPIKTVLLLGAYMLPTWWVKISTYLQSELFLSVIFYNFLSQIVNNIQVSVLCICYVLHMFLFTSSVLMC
jgi:hypothetical protein